MITIRPAAYGAATRLVAALDADLTVRYGPGEPVQVAAADFAPPTGTFLVALVDGLAVGCAGVRRHAEGIAELKRMWVDASVRRRGVARALLRACEGAARSMGYSELWLETGVEQPEALALYAAAGYRPVPPFGQYAAYGNSRCLGKPLPPE